MNFIFISPNFPTIYSHFVKSLKDRGMTVLGIGDTPFDNLNSELKENLTEYCYCSDLGNLQWMKNTVDYLRGKYGPISYLESNNEFWLESDAKLREYKDVINGLRPKDMDLIKYKSKMKEAFLRAGAKVARYILVSTLEASKKFVEQVGYPVFAKPDNGVGAVATFKINNEEELIKFHDNQFHNQYIMEEFVEGYITSFDGICNDDSNVVLAFNETFPKPIAEVVEEDSDVYYYANTEIDPEFRQLGERVIKSFGIKKRCFHIEFFCLTKDKEGLGKAGDIVALECNMRSPGGNTPDLLSLALGASYYDVYADVICSNFTTVNLDVPHKIAISVARKSRFSYRESDSSILAQYADNIKEFGTYSKEISKAMGERYFFATFDTVEEALKFQEFVLRKK
ncbi:MAG: ATP-grasp domain-containing protein [Bacilli bacterium]|nr:ATP-grasp domain-containing protein [Bacilli bacterium]